MADKRGMDDRPTTMTLMIELDAATGASFVRGKDGRLYRRRDVMALEDRARAGDPTAQAALAAVDFGVDERGAPVDREATDAALRANQAAWERGDFDELREIGELGPRKAAPRWMRAGRARRDRAAEAVRDRQRNASMRPTTLDPATLPVLSAELLERGGPELEEALEAARKAIGWR